MKEARMKQEMLKLRQRNYKVLSNVFYHIGFVVGGGELDQKMLLFLASPKSLSEMQYCWNRFFLFLNTPRSV